MAVTVYLFVPYSVAGHVHPILPVVAELAGRGNRVRVLVGERFAGAVGAAGGEVVCLGETPDVYVPERLSTRWVRGRLRRPLVDRRAALLLRAQLSGRDRPDVLVVDPMLGWADRVARRHDVATATVSTTFHPGARALAEVARAGPPWVHGMRPLARRSSRPGRLALANTPVDLQPGGEGASAGVHLVGPLIRPREQPLPRRGGNRVLFVSPGTVFARGARFFQSVVRAFADRPWTVFLATGHLDPAALGPLPANVVARRSLPQLRLLATSDAFITHAGMNSVSEALAAAVPMVFFPRSAEQRHLARRLVAEHVGVWPDRGDLVTLVDRLVTDETVRDACRAWQARCERAAGAARAADLLEEWVRLM